MLTYFWLFFNFLKPPFLNIKQGRGREPERATEHYKEMGREPHFIRVSEVQGDEYSEGRRLASEEQTKPATKVDRANLRPTKRK